MSLASALLSFGALVVVMTLVPGLDTAVVLRGTLARSRSYGLATTLGIMTGLVIWGAVAGAGAAAILTASRAAYRALALYLAWMGASMLWRAWHSRGRTGSRAGLGQEGRSHDGGASPGAPLWRGWLTGMWTDLLNPKAGVFYLATIPHHGRRRPSPGDGRAAGLRPRRLHHAVARRAHHGRLLARPSALRQRGGALDRWTDSITGTVLLGFGARLALDARL